MPTRLAKPRSTRHSGNGAAAKNGNGNGNAHVVREQPLSTFMEAAYRRYAVLTIQARALPDARDGLKPVQRRILYAMHTMGLDHKGPHKKSARVVGEVLGKYHPHGDQSVYEAMVNLAQDFSMRHPLVDGQGNFGSADGDSAAAMRYTEARLAELGELMLPDLKADTVDWQPNFDGSLEEPAVLPARFPNLIVNGATGIAVAMSTNILPHNLGEICEAVIYVARNWGRRAKIKVNDLMEFVPGPDFPTGGILYRYRQDAEGNPVDMIRQAYETGNSVLVCQATSDVQEIGGGKAEVVVAELPYQVQKNTVLERVAANKDRFREAGITDVRDESDYQGMRVVFEVARGADPHQALARLLAQTKLRDSLSYNAIALVKEEGQTVPRYLSLRDILTHFIEHLLDVITRRSQYELKRAEARLHIVLGLLKALSAIDEVIAIIRRSETAEAACTALMKKLALSEEQAKAILDMPLRRLAALERKKLDQEKAELAEQIKRLKEILESEKKRLEVVVEETQDIQERFSTPRRTRIVDVENGHHTVISGPAALEGAQIILLTAHGVRRLAASEYRDSTSPGKPTAKAVEVVRQRLKARPDATLLLVSNLGRVWKGGIARLPAEGAFADLGLNAGEGVIHVAVLDPSGLKANYLVLGTRGGNVKRVTVEDCLSRPEAAWTGMIGLEEGDEVLFAACASDSAHIFLFTSGKPAKAPLDARALRFAASEVNLQATPSARGVAGIKLNTDSLVGGAVLEANGKKAPEGYVVALTEKGFVRKVKLAEFPAQERAGQGVELKITEATGAMVSCAVGQKDSAVDVYSAKGKRLRLLMTDVPEGNRAKRGESLAEAFGDEAMKQVVVV